MTAIKLTECDICGNVSKKHKVSIQCYNEGHGGYELYHLCNECSKLLLDCLQPNVKLRGWQGISIRTDKSL